MFLGERLVSGLVVQNCTHLGIDRDAFDAAGLKALAGHLVAFGDLETRTPPDRDSMTAL
jgi:hypothetical protein